MLMAPISPVNVQSRAQSALRCSPISELRSLLVEQREHALRISGSVSSFYHKQLAQEVVWALCRDIDVELVNQVRVV
jgi:hypothetical protein